mmetsp:Transcript_4634/g.9287  ORF Transcript_4634/g.9287 Transcript_4634/m.9287 type:complete len:118 (-) Transcript_4634:229-582(-)
MNSLGTNSAKTPSSCNESGPKLFLSLISLDTIKKRKGNFTEIVMMRSTGYNKKILYLSNNVVVEWVTRRGLFAQTPCECIDELRVPWNRPSLVFQWDVATFCRTCETRGMGRKSGDD